MTDRFEGERPATLDGIRDWLNREWGAAFESVMESMTQTRPAVVWRSPEEPPSPPQGGETTVDWWSCPLSICPEPLVWVGASQEAWQTLGRSVLGGLGVDDATDDDISSTCRDLVAQSASALAQAMAQRFEMPVTSGDVALAAAPEACREAACDIAPPGAALRLAFGEELLQRLRGGAAAEEMEAPSKQAGALPERFHDLPVTVHVTLGRADLRLADIFKLTVGSVVEVGRLITDPVDIIGNNNLIGKGQVVVSKGNYGVRIVSLRTASSRWE